MIALDPPTRSAGTLLAALSFVVAASACGGTLPSPVESLSRTPAGPTDPLAPTDASSPSATPELPSAIPHPDLSGRIAFDDERDIYVLDLRTGTIDRLTDDPAREINPVWSPDGRSIAYRSNRDGTDDVWLMDAAGGNQINLTRTTDQAEYGPAWSPDGRSIAYNASRRGNVGPLQLQIAATDGSDDRVLDTSFAEFPTWSPDGRRIAFCSMRPGSIGVNPDYDLKLVEVDGSNEHPILTTPDFIETNAQWSPDGSLLAFRRGPVGRQGTQIWTIAPDGSRLRRVTEIGGAIVGWAPGGDKLVFVEPGVDAHVMNPDGSGIVDLGLGPTIGFVSWGR